MTAPDFDDLERVIRGAYRNVPPVGPGLCELCSAPTTSQSYTHCRPCESYLGSGVQLAQGGVVPLSWAPMDSQGYQDLRQYKEASVTPDQLGRLRTLFALAFTRHSACLAKKDDTRPLAVTYIPSTSGLRQGPHPFGENFMSMLSDNVPQVETRYIGPLGGTRNSRRTLAPAHWEIDTPAQTPGRVLVFDDTWVTGGHAQSVAAAFEQQGVAARIVVLGRALDPSRGDHGSFLRSHPADPFDSSICPVHRVVH